MARSIENVALLHLKLSPVSANFSPRSTEAALTLAGGTCSLSDFGRVEGTSPLYLRMQRNESHQK